MAKERDILPDGNDGALGKGLECPNCGCRHFYVDNTRLAFNKIIRSRHCRNCGRRVVTTEKMANL